MVTGQGTVGVVVGIEDEERISAVELVHRGQVQALDRRLALPLQRMMHDEHIKEQHGQRVQVCLGAGQRLAAHHFGRHEARRPQHPHLLALVYGDVVIVANERVAGIGIEKDVAERDVTIAQPFGMELQVDLPE